MAIYHFITTFKCDIIKRIRSYSFKNNFIPTFENDLRQRHFSKISNNKFARISWFQFWSTLLKKVPNAKRVLTGITFEASSSLFRSFVHESIFFVIFITGWAASIFESARPPRQWRTGRSRCSPTNLESICVSVSNSGKVIN